MSKYLCDLPVLTNKEYQALGKVPRVIATYLLDCDGERIRKLSGGSEEHSRYNSDEIEVLIKKPYDVRNIFVDMPECLF